MQTTSLYHLSRWLPLFIQTAVLFQFVASSLTYTFRAATYEPYMWYEKLSLHAHPEPDVLYSGETSQALLAAGTTPLFSMYAYLPASIDCIRYQEGEAHDWIRPCPETSVLLPVPELSALADDNFHCSSFLTLLHTPKVLPSKSSVCESQTYEPTEKAEVEQSYQTATPCPYDSNNHLQI